MSLLLLLLIITSDTTLLQTGNWSAFPKLVYSMKVLGFRENYGLDSQKDWEIAAPHTYHPVPHIHPSI